MNLKRLLELRREIMSATDKVLPSVQHRQYLMFVATPKEHPVSKPTVGLANLIKTNYGVQ